MKQLASAIEQIAEEKGITKEAVLETIEYAIAAAYKKEHNLKGHRIKVTFDPKGGVKEISEERDVVPDELALEAPVDESETLEPTDEDELRYNPKKMLTITEARKLDAKAEIGQTLKLPLKLELDYGRIAAQTAKQVIIQKIRETERDTIFDEYKTKQGELISGTVQREERGLVFADLGRAVGIVSARDRIPNERYRTGDRYQFYVASVDRGQRGPAIQLSRNRPEMLAKLFELEVPEIASKAVEIKAIAREPGARSKVAVTSHETNIDPIGACVGQKGTRVGTVIQELSGENIDIIAWDEESKKFIGNALAPARVLNVELDQLNHAALVEVAPEQLSLAIGRQGQNVRLAARLTGWKIDIKGSGLATATPTAAPSTVVAEKPEVKADKPAQPSAEKPKKTKKQSKQSKKSKKTS